MHGDKCSVAMVSRSSAVWLGTLALWLVTALSAGAAPAITVTGDWSPSLGAADLQSGAGSDLVPTLQSGASQVTVDITGMADDSDSWRLDVRRSDSVWHGDFTLEVRRTSDGLGSGAITGDTSYFQLTAVDLALCEGAGDRSGIESQFRLGGISLQIPPDAYSTTITWTLVDT